MTVTQFDIPVVCSKCGHAGKVFVDDEITANNLKNAMSASFLAGWVPIATRRVVLLLAVTFLLGIICG